MYLVNDIIVVFGMKGYGKTSFIKACLEHLDRYIVIDKQHEYDGFGVVFYNASDLITYLKNRQLDSNRLAPFSVVCQFHTDEDINLIFDIAYSVGKCWIIIEELDFYADAQSISDALYHLINYGRHREVSIIGSARRASTIPRHITGLAQMVVSFYQDEPVDLDYLKKKIGEKALEVRNLKPLKGLAYGKISEKTLDKVFESPILRVDVKRA